MEIFTQVQKAENKLHQSPIVLVHGSWGSSAMWMGYIQSLSEKGWDVYALDLRGHGKSEGDVAGTTMNDYISDIRQAITENDLENPIIIGHSMGGLVTLMYTRDYGARAAVAIDPSPTIEVQIEVQGESEKKSYPDRYSPMDAGMPTDPKEVMEAFPDIPQEKLMKMKEMLGAESGTARSERKLGISVPKKSLTMPVLFVGGELGKSVPFGIGIRTAQAMADYYEKDAIEIEGATHPGILIGNKASDAVEQIESWLITNVTS